MSLGSTNADDRRAPVTLASVDDRHSCQQVVDAVDDPIRPTPGGVVVRQVGSHRRYRSGACVTIVPQHGGRDIAAGTLRAIERDMEPCFGKGWLR